MSHYKELSLDERMAIQAFHEQGLSHRGIGARLGRAASTVCRELSRRTVGATYEADAAQSQAMALRHKARAPRKLSDALLWEPVQRRLKQGWSPQQIAWRLRHEHPEERRKRVSAETIYQAIYLTPRGELRRELLSALRRGHTKRLPRSRGRDRRSEIPDMQSIHIRPPEVNARLVPGHWEGDLIKGAGNRSAVGVLVERVTSFVVLARMQSGSAAHTLDSFDTALRTIPPALRKTLTYDQGREMSYHLALSTRTGVAIYFADPHSPWQRGSCENTNGLLRQYLPKGTDLGIHSQEELDAVALRLNTRPRVRLQGKTPLECYTAQITLDQAKFSSIQ